MASNLVIVESPAKANTIKKYLGKDFEVLASYGHVRDLSTKGAVDTLDDFKMKYQLVDRNVKHVDAIEKAMKRAKALYLATDLDREGEAISWHLLELLEERKVLTDKEVHRVIFHEITEAAIRKAITEPKSVSMELVNAQRARRALDYLVGFNLSPLLWKKIRRGLSAGRVQSPALRLICERESEVEKFVPKEYWTIESDMKDAESAFSARLVEYQGEKLKQFSLTSEKDASGAREVLINASNGVLTVESLESKKRKRNPPAPFTTSTLQQEASRKLGFGTQRTMRIAQQLYEGIDVGNESVGLITYMRTDSLTLSSEFLAEVRGFVADWYGAAQIPPKARVFRTNSKNAQEAHEAVRPTSSLRTPSDLGKHLEKDQLKLYELIWKRSVACQMVHATINTVAVALGAGGQGVFRATGSTIEEPGFLRVYEDSDEGEAKEQKVLPPLRKGQKLAIDKIRAEQHFTEPPPRYTEASLVKTLEEYGIGRPSTYASIISTLLQREYVDLEKKRFTPTDVGRVVNNFLTDHFSSYVDYEFTANLENELDAVSRGEKEWVPLLKDFWEPFSATVEEKTENVSRPEKKLGIDPDSGKPVSVRMGKNGPYIMIGTVDDEEKPKFYGLRTGMRMDQVNLDDALEIARELSKFPRILGEGPDGEISVNLGRYGPYVKFGERKFASLREGQSPEGLTLDDALQLIEEKKKQDASKNINEFVDEGIKVLNGRFGPYVTDGNKNAKIPKDKDPSSLTLEDCKELIAAAPPKRGRRRTKK